MPDMFGSPKPPKPTDPPPYSETVKTESDLLNKKRSAFERASTAQSQLGANQLKANGSGLRIF